MTTMIRGAVLREFGKPVNIEEFKIDDPAYNEVLVRTAACGVCHSDLHFQHGSLGGKLPMVLGHEPAGIVEEVGSSVRSVKPGDHVIICDMLYCGTCQQCLSGKLYMCTNRAATQRPRGGPSRLSQGGRGLLQFADVAGFAEALLVHEHAVVRIDQDIPLDRAALVGCGIVTGLGAVFNTAEVKPGSSVAVFGCGGVGTSVIQGARIAGARQIIAVDIHPKKLERATHFGATHTLLSDDGDVVANIVEISGGGVNYAFDVVAHPKLTAQCVYSLARRGLAVVVGTLPFDKPLQFDLATLHFVASEKKLTGSFMGSTRFPLEIPRYLDLYRQKRLDLDSMVSARVPLEGLADALTAMERGEVLTRTMITFNVG